MEFERLKPAVESIRMTEAAKHRAAAALAAKAGAPRPHVTWRRPALALAILALLLALAMPVFASVEPVYRLMYLVSPAVAQFFRPVQQSCEDQGLRMEVVSVYIHDDTAQIYLTVQDVTGGHTDGPVDLNDSYAIRSPFDCAAACSRVGYDEASRTSTFLVTLSGMKGTALTGNKITFSVGQLVSGRHVYEGISIPLDLSCLEEAAGTQTVRSIGGGGPGYQRDPDSPGMFFEVLVPGAADPDFPVEGIDLTGAALVEGQLHLQTAVRDHADNDNHGYFYLLDNAGQRVDSYYSASFVLRGDEGTDYTEEVFCEPAGGFSQYGLYGDFWIAGRHVEGDWQVTFPLEPTD